MPCTVNRIRLEEKVRKWLGWHDGYKKSNCPFCDVNKTPKCHQECAEIIGDVLKEKWDDEGETICPCDIWGVPTVKQWAEEWLRQRNANG